MIVGESGHHVPAIRKAQNRIFQVSRGNKSRPTLHIRGNKTTVARNHARLHRAERNDIGPRQGDYQGSDPQLFNAYRRSYEGLDDIRVDVRSPNGKYNLAKDVSPTEAVEIIRTYLQETGQWIPH